MKSIRWLSAIAVAGAVAALPVATWAAEHGGTTMQEHGGTAMEEPAGTTMPQPSDVDTLKEAAAALRVTRPDLAEKLDALAAKASAKAE